MSTPMGTPMNTPRNTPGNADTANAANPSVFAPDYWENEGRRLAHLVDQECAIVVAARDSYAAAWISVGIARVQGARRRVAIADLVSETAVFDLLLSHDDPHGISDSFLYGVSLNKIARPMRDAANVFIMPSGTERTDHEAIYSNDRWRRLAAGFHQVDALLIIVANPAIPGFLELCGHVGTLMPTGGLSMAAPAGVALIAAPIAAPMVQAPPQSPSVAPSESEPASVATKESARRAREAAQQDETGRRTHILAILLVIGAIAIVVGVTWPQLLDRLPRPLLELIGRPIPVDSAKTVVPPTPMDTVPRANVVPDPQVSGNQDSADSAAGNGDSKTNLVIDNPADSSVAARYSIYFATANTRSAAIPDEKILGQSGVAISPVVESGEQWFRVTVGATSSKPEAEALLNRLRSQKLIGSGSIVSVPFALRLERQVASTMVAARLAALKARGIEAYALRQGDGSAFIYTGAFESPVQATVLADSLRTMGVAPVLAYRTGRGF